MTGEVQSLLKTRETAFRVGDAAALKIARNNLARGIRRAKQQHTARISNNFADNRDPRQLWQEVQAITDYKAPAQVCDSNPSLPDRLNSFFAQFEATNKECQNATAQPEEHTLHLTPSSMKRALTRVNPRKAAGPDNIPGWYLRDCADQLKDVFEDIFNTSLLQSVVPDHYHSCAKKVLKHDTEDFFAP